MADPGVVPEWSDIVRAVEHRLRVKHNDVGVTALAYDALAREGVRGRGKAGHPANSFFERKDILLADIATEHPGKVPMALGCVIGMPGTYNASVPIMHLGWRNNVTMSSSAMELADMDSGELVKTQEVDVRVKRVDTPCRRVLGYGLPDRIGCLWRLDNEQVGEAALQDVVVPFLSRMVDTVPEFLDVGWVFKPPEQDLLTFDKA